MKRALLIVSWVALVINVLATVGLYLGATYGPRPTANPTFQENMLANTSFFAALAGVVLAVAAGILALIAAGDRRQPGWLATVLGAAALGVIVFGSYVWIALSAEYILGIFVQAINPFLGAMCVSVVTLLYALRLRADPRPA